MDLKADEAGLLAAVRARDWPLAVFPAAGGYHRLLDLTGATLALTG